MSNIGTTNKIGSNADVTKFGPPWLAVSQSGNANAIPWFATAINQAKPLAAPLMISCPIVNLLKNQAKTNINPTIVRTERQSMAFLSIENKYAIPIRIGIAMMLTIKNITIPPNKDKLFYNHDISCTILVKRFCKSFYK